MEHQTHGAGGREPASLARSRDLLDLERELQNLLGANAALTPRQRDACAGMLRATFDLLHVPVGTHPLIDVASPEFFERIQSVVHALAEVVTQPITRGGTPGTAPLRRGGGGGTGGYVAPAQELPPTPSKPARFDVRRNHAAAPVRLPQRASSVLSATAAPRRDLRVSERGTPWYPSEGEGYLQTPSRGNRFGGTPEGEGYLQTPSRGGSRFGGTPEGEGYLQTPSRRGNRFGGTPEEEGYFQSPSRGSWYGGTPHMVRPSRTPSRGGSQFGYPLYLHGYPLNDSSDEFSDEAAGDYAEAFGGARRAASFGSRDPPRARAPPRDPHFEPARPGGAPAPRAARPVSFRHHRPIAPSPSLALRRPQSLYVPLPQALHAPERPFRRLNEYPEEHAPLARRLEHGPHR